MSAYLLSLLGRKETTTPYEAEIASTKEPTESNMASKGSKMVKKKLTAAAATTATSVAGLPTATAAPESTSPSPSSLKLAAKPAPGKPPKTYVPPSPATAAADRMTAARSLAAAMPGKKQQTKKRAPPKPPPPPPLTGPISTASDIPYLCHRMRRVVAVYTVAGLPEQLKDVNSPDWQNASLVRATFVMPPPPGSAWRKPRPINRMFPMCLMLDAKTSEDRVRVINWWISLKNDKVALAKEYDALRKIYAVPSKENRRLSQQGREASKVFAAHMSGKAAPKVAAKPVEDLRAKMTPATLKRVQMLEERSLARKKRKVDEELRIAEVERVRVWKVQQRLEQDTTLPGERVRIQHGLAAMGKEAVLEKLNEATTTVEGLAFLATFFDKKEMPCPIYKQCTRCNTTYDDQFPSQRTCCVKHPPRCVETIEGAKKGKTWEHCSRCDKNFNVVGCVRAIKDGGEWCYSGEHTQDQDAVLDEKWWL